ncbi:M12 family metallo-peptidase [Saprospiraceae bacterium]|jgi:subtilisin-like proprotein convertase family protein|nr:M12 family metallo-peptidase [Saprospiraceae bacterium]
MSQTNQRIMKFCFTILIATFSMTFLSAQNYWTDIDESQMVLPENAEWEALPTEYRTLSLDLGNLKDYMSNAPMEFTQAAKTNLLEISLPMPDGSFEVFEVFESPSMHPDLTARFPEIRSFAGIGKNNKNLRTRFDHSYIGFHGTISGLDDVIYIQPYAYHQEEYHIAYFRNDFVPDNYPESNCGVIDNLSQILEDNPIHGHSDDELNNRSGGEVDNVKMSVYELVMSCSGEYAASHGGTVPSVLSTFNTATNRLNELLGNDANIRLELVPLTTLFIYLDAATDPYNITSTSEVQQSICQSTFNSLLGTENYDIGHLFQQGICTTNSGTTIAGQASLGAVCSGSKGRGITCHFSNVLFMAENTWAHEVGHSFDAGHTWNNCPNSNPQFNSGAAYEPGSGSTILSYSGSCGNQNIPDGGVSYYHVASIVEMTNFTQLGSGKNCPNVQVLDNLKPTLELPYENGFFIPISTPFELTGFAEDEDNGAMTFCWEQFDLGFNSPMETPFGNAPIFRSFPPNNNPTRTFPRLPIILSNGFEKTETLPTYSRDLTFRLTVRDNNLEGGGTIWEEVAFHATDQAGPFLVMNPNLGTEEWAGGDLVEVTWDVANTTNSIVNCQHVNIKLSTDGGFNYPYTLASFTPNDGSQEVYIPDVSSSTARIKVEAADNIFFDLSNFNHNIIPATEPGYTVNLSSEYEKVCVPTNSNLDFELTTENILNFDSLIQFEVLGGLPMDATYAFSQNPILAGENTTLNINMDNVLEVGDFMVDLIATAPGGDTAYFTLNFNVLNNDFSDLKMQLPANGATSLGLLADFEWVDVSNADFYDIEISTSPQFGVDQIVDAAYNIDVATFTPSVAFLENELYYWRIRPLNSCGTGEFLTPFAFHTFTVDCTNFESSDVPKNLPVQGTPTIPSELIVTEDGIITDVNILGLKGEHDALADIAAYITSPAGTRVQLFGDLPCFVIPFNFKLDDEAAFDIACPPINGLAYRPTESLSAFDGESTFGTWTLEIDIVDPIGNGGFLSDWGVQFCASTNPKNPYIVNNEILQVPELGERAVASSKLLVEDEDNTAAELIYTLVEAPQNGTLISWGTPKFVGTQFKQTDINSFGLRYQHEVMGTTADFFTFVVEDGSGGFVGVEKFEIEVNNDAPVNTDEVSLENNISIFPNPTSNLLNIGIDQPIEDEVIMNVLDVTGKVVSQRKFNFIHSNIELNTTELSAGIYFLSFQMENAIATKRFVIQR